MIKLLARFSLSILSTFSSLLVSFITLRISCGTLRTFCAKDCVLEKGVTSKESVVFSPVIMMSVAASSSFTFLSIDLSISSSNCVIFLSNKLLSEANKSFSVETCLEVESAWLAIVSFVPSLL